MGSADKISYENHVNRKVPSTWKIGIVLLLTAILALVKNKVKNKNKVRQIGPPQNIISSLYH